MVSHFLSARCLLNGTLVPEVFLEWRLNLVDPEKVSFTLSRVCFFNRGNKYKDYANIFSGPNFASLE